jgi:hypothetical protein
MLFVQHVHTSRERARGRVNQAAQSSFRGDLRRLAEMAARLDDTAAQAGRDLVAIRRGLNVGGTISDGAAPGALWGPVDRWVDELADLALAHDFDTFIQWAAGADRSRRSPATMVATTATAPPPARGRRGWR